MRSLFLFAIALFVITVPYSFAGSSATTYYVSPSGSDSNSGSASAPWQSVSRVNGAALQPGDSVLFQGGQTFSDATLTPPASGTASAPIHFGSYGTGQAELAGSWIPSGGHDLVFDNLDFTGSSILFASAASGPGTYNITIQNSSFHDTPDAAINVANTGDHDWTITNNSLHHLGDSGIFVWGSNITISHSTISDTGWNPAITWGKHGIYDKGPNTTIAYNDFSANTGGQAISLRFHGAHVYGNTIHDTDAAIAFFDDDTAPAPQGTDYIYDNRAWNITGYGFYDSGETDPQGHPPTVGFVLASNTFALTSAAEAINVSETPTAPVTLANNIFTGSYGSAYRGCNTCTENNNDWYGGTTNIPTGRGDLHVDPAISAGPALAAATGSSVVDAGTTTVPGLTYVAACDGAPLHYCGSRPDMGAAESASATAPVATPAPPASGTSGPSGATGPSGASGATGPSGATGVSGNTGPAGPSGSDGASPPAPTSGNPAPPADPRGVAPPDPATPLVSAPDSLRFVPSRGGGRFSWHTVSAASGYRVLVNGNIVATTSTPFYRFRGLGCSTTFTVGVAAVNAAGNVSPTETTSADTDPCMAIAPSSLGHDVTRGAAFQHTIGQLRRQLERFRPRVAQHQ